METFEERAVSAGIAFSEDGIARAGMGVDAADYDRSGHASLIITNFRTRCYRSITNEGNGCSWTKRRARSWPRNSP